MVSETVVVLVVVPSTAETVRVAVPAAAVVAAASVITLEPDPETEAGLKEAVTPVGSPATLSAAVPAFATFRLTLAVPPGRMFTAVGEACTLMVGETMSVTGVESFTVVPAVPRKISE
jgi:hypothetical protein